MNAAVAEEAPNPPPKLSESYALLRRSWLFIRPVWGYLGYNCIIFSIWLATELAIPWLSGEAISEIQKAHAAGSKTFDVTPWIVGLGITVLLRVAFSYLRASRVTELTQRILLHMRRELYDAIQRQPFRFHDDSQAGALITVMTQDMQRVRAIFDQVLFGFLDILIFIMGAMIIMIHLQWDMGLVVLGAFVGTAGLLFHFSTKLRVMWRDSWDKYDEVTSVLQENISGVQVVRAFARETEEIAKFGGRSQHFLDSFLKTVQYWSARIPLVQFLFRMVAPVVLLWGGWKVMQGTMPIGYLGSYMMYLGNIGYRLRTIGDLVSATQNGISATERVFAILDRTPDIRNSDQPVPLPEGRGRIEFRDIAMSYVAGTDALKGISMVVEPGEVVAVVGPTGAGKTTLVSLIARYYDPSRGSILLDGVDVRRIDLPQLRRAVAMVFQETFLFSASVRANLAYGRPEATDSEIYAAATAAQAGDFIDQLKDGFRTVIGERGQTLSGGQRQRLAIARALVGDPRVLILDDATASVDPSTEKEIASAIESAVKGRTTFIIAHRLSTVRRADRIIVLEQGQIVATGSHQDLLRDNAFYREMCEIQLLDDSRPE